MGSSLLLRANTQAAFMDQPYVQQQYQPAATSAPVYAPDPMACAVYLRLHPMSVYVGSTTLWIATLGSGSVEELRTADQREVGPGDIFLLETPGGGGYLPEDTI